MYNHGSISSLGTKEGGYQDKEGDEEEEEACDVASLREDFERLGATRNKIGEQITDLKEQNKEVFDHIVDAQGFKHMLVGVQNKITVTNERLNKMILKLQHPLSAIHDGVLIWKIPDYNIRREDVDRAINSPPFYSSSYGYKLCGQIYLNGDGLGQGTHLSFYFAVMKGEYDALLPWPFTQNVTLMLLDQDERTQNLSDTFRPNPDSSSFRRPQTEMNVPSGISRFVEHSVLETPTYLQDNTIFLRIKVDVDNIPGGAAASVQGDDVEGVEEEGP